MKGRIQTFNNVASHTPQLLEPKMFGKREENGVSTQPILSMRFCAYIEEKHAKRDKISKHAIFTPLGT